MRLKLVKSRALPIGIDLGTAAVKVAQVRRVDGAFELLAAARAELPAKDRSDTGRRLGLLAEGLARAIGSQKFLGKRCVLALPAVDTVIQHIKLPKLPADQLAGAVARELEGKLPFSPGEAIIRHVVVGQAYDEQRPVLEMIVVAAARDTVEAYLDLARRSRLEVTALNVEPFAIVECFSHVFRRDGDAERANLFLDLGEANTQVVIAHGRQLAFARNLMVGSVDLDKAVADQLGVSAAEVGTLRRRLLQLGQRRPPEADALYDAMGGTLDALADEITKCLHYYKSVFPSRTIERAIFLGGQAMDRRLCQSIARHLDLPAQIGDPLARITRAGSAGREAGLDRRVAQPAWAVAVGLSVGAELPQAA